MERLQKLLTVGLIKKILLNKMSYIPESYPTLKKKNQSWIRFGKLCSNSSNINEAIRAVLNFSLSFFYEKILYAQKAQKALKALKAPKNTKMQPSKSTKCK